MSWLLLSCVAHRGVCLQCHTLLLEIADATCSSYISCAFNPVTPVTFGFEQLGSDNTMPAWLASHACQGQCHTASPPYPTTHHTQHQHTAYLLYTCKTPARASQSCKQRQPHARKSIRRLLQFKVQRVQQASEAHLVRPCPHSQAATPATSYNDVTVDVGIQEEGQFFAVTACRAERKHRHKVRHLFGPAMTSATGDVLCLPQACSQSA